MLKFLTCEKYVLVKKSNMATGCWGMFGLAFKGLETFQHLQLSLLIKVKVKAPTMKKKKKLCSMKKVT